MRRYFKNLLSALLGNNPYEAELDDLRRQMEQAAENVERLRDIYCAACEKWAQGDKQVASLQQLVENLRERIADKDAVIDQLKKEYREYTKQAKETTNKS
jgi:chromosome segregation ATPase